MQDLKEIARELGAPAGGRKEELVAGIIAAQVAPEGDELDDHALGEDPADDLNEEPAAGAAAADNGAAEAAAAEGKHASIVFALDTKEVCSVHALSIGTTWTYQPVSLKLQLFRSCRQHQRRPTLLV